MNVDYSAELLNLSNLSQSHFLNNCYWKNINSKLSVTHFKSMEVHERWTYLLKETIYSFIYSKDIGEEGIATLGLWGWPNPWHLALDRWDWQSNSHINIAQGKRTLSANQEHMGAPLRNRVNSRVCGAGFALSRRWGALWSPQEDVINFGYDFESLIRLCKIFGKTHMKKIYNFITPKKFLLHKWGLYHT